ISGLCIKWIQAILISFVMIVTLTISMCYFTALAANPYKSLVSSQNSSHCLIATSLQLMILRLLRLMVSAINANKSHEPLFALLIQLGLVFGKKRQEYDTKKLLIS
ncbi:hypothetical protein OAX29_00720, partial [bacterium]|nr:hypothetical protein [bacterium]